MKAPRFLSVLLVAALLASTIQMALPTQTVYAATITVTNTNDSGPGSLRQAIADAGSGETITFGLTTPVTITLTSGELHIDKDLAIIGPGADQLTLDGNNASRVFYINDLQGGYPTVEISGLTIANGLASDGDDTSVSDGDKGGGIHSSGAYLTLTDVTFNDNTASEMGGGIFNILGSSPDFTDVTFSGNTAASGGGMYNNNSNPNLTNVTFSGNTASSDGGGMYNINNSSPDLTDVTFSGNTASESGGGMYNDVNSSPTLSNVTFSGNIARYGGGMYNEDYSSPILTNVTFSNNTANSMGGGMYNYRSSPNLTNVTFNSNTATGDGGGMYNDQFDYSNSDVTNPTLTNVTFSGNTARYGGGMYNNPSSIPTLTNVTFSGNTADNGGGGMYNIGSNPDLTNVTFSGNIADNGGGMYNDSVDTFSSSPTLSNVTFSGNTADDGSGGGNGGGMYNASNCSPTLENVILWGDSAGTSGDEMFNYDSTTTPTITDSVIAGGPPPTGSPTWKNIIINNPDLGTLADNGGPTKTIALGTNSSAIDAGGQATTCASTDQRGAARPYGSGCDIGAYEVRESIAVGTCGGSVLNGAQTFNFTASGNTVTVDVDTGDGLTCITVEEMGPGASHPMATGPGTSDDALLTNNWWHITGNITSGFSVDITLPYSSADADSRVCRWPGGLGGYGWDCDDGTNTSFGAGTVTRTGVNSFSDWAVGDNVGPTAVTLTALAIDDAAWLPVGLFAVLGLLALGAVRVMLVRKRR